MYKQKCIKCGREFETKRPAKTCGEVCRKSIQRTPQRSVPDDNVTDKQERIVTDKNTSNYKIVGQSWADKKTGKTQDMYFCNNHLEHAKDYCEKVCDESCNHIYKEGIFKEGVCRSCGKTITEAVYGEHWKLVECCYECCKQS